LLLHYRVTGIHTISVDNDLTSLCWVQLNKSYPNICKSTQVPAVGMQEFTSMCGVLNDQVEMQATVLPFIFILLHEFQKYLSLFLHVQGLLKLGNSREDRLKRVTLQIDSSDVTFAFKQMD